MDRPLVVTKKVEHFFGRFPLRRYDKGQLLLLSDENPTSIFYLVSGFVREYDISRRGDEIVVNVFKPETFFPMSWAIVKIANRYFFEADTEVTTREAPPDDVMAFITVNPDVMLDLLSRLYYGVDGMRRRMAHLMGGSAKSRLLFELIVEARRFGAARRDGSYVLAMNESELGARSGLSRETVSREIHELKDKQLLSVNRRGIVLKNIGQLETKLGTTL